MSDEDNNNISTTNNISLYECIFNTRKLGLIFKFYNTKLYVINYDDTIDNNIENNNNNNNNTIKDNNLLDNIVNNSNNSVILNNKISAPVSPQLPTLTTNNEIARIPGIPTVTATSVVTTKTSNSSKSVKSSKSLPTASVITVSDKNESAANSAVAPVAAVIILGTVEQFDPFASSNINSNSVSNTAVYSNNTTAYNNSLKDDSNIKKKINKIKDENNENNENNVKEEANSYKIIIMCNEIFGIDIKKVCKIELINTANKVCAQAEIDKLYKLLLTKYNNLPNDKILHLKYYDNDVNENIELDIESWNEFINQNKKILSINIGDKIIKPVEYNNNNNNKIDSNNKIDNNNNEMEIDIDTLNNNINEEIVSTNNTIIDTTTTNNNNNNTVVINEINNNDLETSKPIIGSYVYSVNNVKVVGLSKDVILNLLKQQKRPMIMEFMYDINLIPPFLLNNNNNNFNNNNNLSDNIINSPNLKRLNTGNKRIPYELFLNKYNHNSASSIRKQFDKWMTEYVEGDWSGKIIDNRNSTTSNDRMSNVSNSVDNSIINKTNSSINNITPSQFIISIYKYIQQKLEKLGLFDNSKPQGGGMPIMEEEQWDDIMDHIEYLVCNKIFKFTINTLAPKYCINNINDINGNNITLNNKLSSLKFLTLEHLGLYWSKSPNIENSKPSKYLSTFPIITNITTNNTTTTTNNNNNNLDHNISMSLLSEQEEWRLAMRELCRSIEFDTPREIMKRLVTSTNIITHATEAYLLNGYSIENNNNINNNNLNKLNKQPSIAIRKSLSNSNTLSLSADELVPAISWAVLQANPINFDSILWFCEEFRHPDRMHGESAYVLAQLSSALEFCRSIVDNSNLDISIDDFNKYKKRDELTKQLLVACKKGDLKIIRECLQLNENNIINTNKIIADINGLDLNQKDRPLTCCIRYQQIEIIKLLLIIKNSNLRINARISPCYGGNESGFTALHLATICNQLDTVLLLLSNGADRYILDDNGQTPLSLATTLQNKEIVNILLADPNLCNILDHIRGNNLQLVEGLIKQQIDINNLSDDQLTFPLLETIKTGNIMILKYLLKFSKNLNINKINKYGETALMYLAYVDANNLYSNGDKIDYEYLLLQLIKLLIEYGANRYLKTSYIKDNNNNNNKLAIDICRNELIRLQSIILQAENNNNNNDNNNNILVINNNNNIFDISHQHKLSIDEMKSYCKGLIKVINILKYDPLQYQICEMSRLKMPDAVEALCEQQVDLNIPDPAKGFTALIAAVFNEDIDMISLLLRYSYINTVKTYASVQDTTSDNIIKKEKEKLKIQQPKLNINKEGRNGMRALHYAAQCGNPSICGILLQYGADRNLTNDQGHTAIKIATINGHIDTVNVLRYDPEIVPICLAAKHGDWIVIKSLLYQGVSINTFETHYENDSFNTIICHDLSTILIATIAYKQQELFNNLFNNTDMISLIQNKIIIDMPNMKGETPLMYACITGDENMIIILLRKGANRYLVDSNNQTALDIAKANGQSAGILHILEYDPNQYWLHDLIRENNFKGVVALLKQHVDVNLPRFNESNNNNITNNNNNNNNNNKIIPIVDGELPLTVAAANNCKEIISLLLKSPDIEINRCDGLGRNALFYACMYGFESIVLLLLKNKANRKSKDFNLISAVDIAIANGHLQIAAILQTDPKVVHIHDMCTEGRILMVNALLLQGCPINYKDERTGMNFQTPLLAACTAGKIEIVKLLTAKSGISLDEPDTLGRTPLMCAIGCGALNITAILLSGGCNRNAVDNKGKNAKDYAYSHGIGTRMSFMSQEMMF